MEKNLVSVIIVNYNGKHHLEACLESLAKVTYKPLEVILVDNNSTDSSIEFVKKEYPSVAILKLDKNYGFAKPNNEAAKMAKGGFFLFLNNDTIVKPDFVTALVDAASKDPKIAICQSLLLKPSGEVDSSGDFIDELGISFSSIKQVNKMREISSARGASMLIRRDVFEKLGGFDEVFFASFEDVDLGWRSWIMGYKAVMVPQSVVYHLVAQTTKTMKNEMAFHGFKNQLCMKITNFESKLVLKKLFLFFVIYGYRVFRVWFDYKLKGHTGIKSTDYEEKTAQKPSFKIIFKSILWLVCHLGYLHKKHRQVNSSRTQSTAELEKMNIISNSKK